MNDNGSIKRHVRKLLYGPLLIFIIIALFFVAALFIDEVAARFLAILAGIVLIGTLVWIFVQRRSSYDKLIGYTEQLSGDTVIQLDEFPLPMIVSDRSGRIVWSNAAFEDIFGKKGGMLSEAVPELSAELPAAGVYGETVFNRADRVFYAVMNGFKSDGDLVSIRFIDDTDRILSKRRAEEQKPVLGAIYVDNYDEVMGSIENVRQSLLAAIIERKLTKYFGAYGGILHKTEKDKYSITINKKGLDEIERNRFAILEEIKGANIGNTVAPTLSIGVGADGASLNEDADLSRTAMDLCLGRGGDQAIVRTSDDTRYYGGKSNGQERFTRVKARVKAQALKELFMTKDQIMVMGHRLPDMDALGAAIGIYRVAKAMAKKVHIVLEEETSSIKPMVQRFKTDSDYPEDLFIKKEKALEILDENTAIVVVDVNKPSYTECPELIYQSNCIVVLDHHRQGGEAIANATLSYIEPYASSASEMVAEILQYMMVSIKLPSIEAEAMYAGIVIDTNNFMNKTGVRTFEAAAFLRRSGADMARVRKMFKGPMADYQAKAETIRNVEVYGDRFAIGICNSEGLESPTIVAAQAANELLDIIGVKASIVFTKFHDKVYISARSIDEVNVQLIMERLGGGGHLSIAGAQLAGCEIEEAIALVKETINQMTEEGAI